MCVVSQLLEKLTGLVLLQSLTSPWTKGNASSAFRLQSKGKYSMLGVGANSGNVFSGISYERNHGMNCHKCCPIQF